MLKVHRKQTQRGLTGSAMISASVGRWMSRQQNWLGAEVGLGSNSPTPSSTPPGAVELGCAGPTELPMDNRAEPFYLYPWQMKAIIMGRAKWKFLKLLFPSKTVNGKQYCILEGIAESNYLIN